VQVSAGHISHGEIQDAAVLPGRVDGDDVRMIDD